MPNEPTLIINHVPEPLFSQLRAANYVYMYEQANMELIKRNTEERLYKAQEALSKVIKDVEMRLNIRLGEGGNASINLDTGEIIPVANPVENKVIKTPDSC
jgi:hypothetical protein